MQGNLHIYLNDCDPLVVARNAVLLQIVSAPSFNPDNENDFDFFWDVCYNARWPTKTLKRFKRVLKQLLRGDVYENIVIEQGNVEQIVSIWRSWLNIRMKSFLFYIEAKFSIEG